jgi:hypothetical protein
MPAGRQSAAMLVPEHTSSLPSVPVLRRPEPTAAVGGFERTAPDRLSSVRVLLLSSSSAEPSLQEESSFPSSPPSQAGDGELMDGGVEFVR